jgi:hypothetical protein
MLPVESQTLRKTDKKTSQRLFLSEKDGSSVQSKLFAGHEVLDDVDQEWESQIAARGGVADVYSFAPPAGSVKRTYEFKQSYSQPKRSAVGFGNTVGLTFAELKQSLGHAIASLTTAHEHVQHELTQTETDLVVSLTELAKHTSDVEAGAPLLDSLQVSSFVHFTLYHFTDLLYRNVSLLSRSVLG